jgi:transcriptional regulator with XRE-family HTH domain
MEMTMPNNIRTYRKTKGLTQAELAEAASISLAQLKCYDQITFSGTIKQSTQETIAHILGALLEQIFPVISAVASNPYKINRRELLTSAGIAASTMTFLGGGNDILSSVIGPTMKTTKRSQRHMQMPIDGNFSTWMLFESLNPISQVLELPC